MRRRGRGRGDGEETRGEGRGERSSFVSDIASVLSSRYSLLAGGRVDQKDSPRRQDRALGHTGPQGTCRGGGEGGREGGRKG